jgi:pyruvate/2-oxoglutarate dehydrogenase complex dihydrolipoamide dehydrogenase (E3) component
VFDGHGELSMTSTHRTLRVVRSVDVVIVGGGAAGLVAARDAHRRKAKVVMVQSGPVGGECTFTGCVPSKALLAAAARGSPFAEAMTAVKRSVGHIAATEDATALAAEGIEVIPGYASFTSPTTIDVDGSTIRSRRFIVATGSKPFVPPIPGLRELPPLTNENLFNLALLPRSLAVLGGGPIGCEMAQAFARLGSKVTVFEAMDRLLPREEPEASAVVAAALVRDGVEVHTGCKVTNVERLTDGSARLTAETGLPVEAEHVLVAIGRVPSGRGFGLEEIGVKVDTRGAIVVDDAMATNVPGIWAIGDVTGRLQFTHVAGRMGFIASTNALSKTARIRPLRFSDRVIPWTTFTSPEIAHVGLTEAEAALKYPKARVAFLPMSRVDRAIATGAEDGFVLLIAAPKRGIGHVGGGRIVGATVVAPTAGELIHEVALAMQTNMFAGRLAQTVHAYPTWSMAIQQAALQFFGHSAGLTARPVSNQGAPT